LTEGEAFPRIVSESADSDVRVTTCEGSANPKCLLCRYGMQTQVRMFVPAQLHPLDQAMYRIPGLLPRPHSFPAWASHSADHRPFADIGNFPASRQFLVQIPRRIPTGTSRLRVFPRSGRTARSRRPLQDKP
jgi:hypothetical protein